MEGVQAERTLAAARRFDLAIETRWRELYRWTAEGKPSYDSSRAYHPRLGLKVRELCARHGLRDRMPRYTGTGPLAVNKLITEQLFLKTYDLELAQAPEQRIWAYRKAAWVIDELPQSIGELFETRGEVGLQELPGIGKSIAQEIAGALKRAPAQKV